MDFALDRLGWQSFQDLCVALAEERLGRPVQTFLPTNDAGRDGAFVGLWDSMEGGESTIQCKFTSKRDHNLTLSMLSEELPKAQLLAAKGLADDYIILTNHPVTGQSELAIRDAFQARGVGRCRVFHRDWIITRINESPRLRMMVPRLYGLADLASVLGHDQRAYKQAQLVLSEMGDNLRKFVVTEPHRKSVRALNEHGVVLLLGEPAAGKSTIGASLALAAADLWKCSTIKATSPESLEARIDPDSKQFFWIDDAFGSTQYQRARTEGWNQLFPHMQAALKNGSKFLITSRTYIWRSAEKELKSSAFPALKNSHVIIHTQNLSKAEKGRILYNHIKLGDQSLGFRKGVKPFLNALSERKDFLPETARRLGDPLFTKALHLSAAGVASFFEKPTEFLEQTIDNLADASRAAIALLFLSGGVVRSPVSVERLSKPSSDYGVAPATIREQLSALDGSLLILAEDEEGPYWTYRHPTISDAFAAHIAKDPERVEIYLRGAKPESMVHEIVCAGAKLAGAKVVVPNSLIEILLERISSLSASTLGTFISYRANRLVADRLIEARPDILNSFSYFNVPLKEDSDVDLLTTLHEFGLLPELHRLSFVARLKEAVLESADSSFLDSEQIGDVLTDSERAELLSEIEDTVLGQLAGLIERSKKEWDSDYDPDDYFDPLLDSIEVLAKAVGADAAAVKKQATALADDAVWEMRDRYVSPPSNDGQQTLKSELASNEVLDLFRDVDE